MASFHFCLSHEDRASDTDIGACSSSTPINEKPYLSHRFWAEALSTAVYVRNRSPTKALQSMTPCEAWHGIKPNVKTLRIFGCRVYAHVPKVERRKLEPKARKCVLLGYGEQKKGHRLFDISSAKVIHSRDVVFNESSMPGN